MRGQKSKIEAGVQDSGAMQRTIAVKIDDLEVFQYRVAYE